MRLLKQMLATVNSRVIDNQQSSGGVPSNSSTQTTTINSSVQSGFIVFFVLLGIVAIILTARWIIHNFSEKETDSKNEEPTAAPSPSLESQEAQTIYEKIRHLDSADLSKADGFIEALLTAEKYKNSPKSTNSKS